MNSSKRAAASAPPKKTKNGITNFTKAYSLIDDEVRVVSTTISPYVSLEKDVEVNRLGRFSRINSPGTARSLYCDCDRNGRWPGTLNLHLHHDHYLRCHETDSHSVLNAPTYNGHGTSPHRDPILKCRRSFLQNPPSTIRFAFSLLHHGGLATNGHSQTLPSPYIL